MKNRKIRHKFTASISVMLAAVLFFGAVSESTAVKVYADEEDETAVYSSDEIIIIYEEEALELDEALSGTSSDDATLEDLGVTSQKELVSSDSDQGAVTLATVSEDTDLEELIEELESDENIAYVQPNYTYELFADETSDPYLSDDSSAEINQYYLYSSSFTDAWSLSKTEGEVTVAVLDTGANLLHEDLAENLDAEHAYDVTTGTLLSESGVSNNGDSNGHGTLVSGIIAAVTDNETGIAGAGYNATVLPVKVFDSNDVCTTADLLNAYAYLAGLIEAGEASSLKIINLSLGYYTSQKSETDTALEEAILDMLETYGVLTVCADGNSSDGTYCYPADFEETISVAAVNAAGETASFSYFDESTDLSAYGVGIYSTSADGGYEAASGTSFAAPQVCAALALILAADTSLSSEDAADILIDNASDQYCLIDVYAAVADALGYEEAQEDIEEETEEDSEGEDNDSDSEGGLETEEEASSWRYSNGSVISTPITDTETSSSDISLFASTSVYSSWTSDDGTAAYRIVTETSKSSSYVSVPVSGVARVGIDVSKWNGEIDWEAVAASGVTYAIIRCGYGSDYTSQDDSQFLANVEGALSAGLEIGIYLYSYATVAEGSAPSAESEAEHVLRLLEEAGLEPDDLDLPVFLDLEESDQADLDASVLGDIAQTFCDAIEAEGYTVGIYANKNWWENYLTDSAFNDENWYKWVARYPTSSSVTETEVDGTDIWQVSSKGVVDGITTSVDIDFDYLGSGSYTTVYPGQVTISSASLATSLTSATLKWSKTSNTTGYKIYRSVDGGSYTLIKTITSNSTVSYTDSSLSLGKTYKYKIRAYNTTGGSTYYGSYSSAKSLTTKPSTVTISSASVTTAGKIAVKWKKVSNATGYVIYRSVNGGSYSKVKTISSNSTVSWTDSSVSAGKVYRYKIRAYKKSGSTTVYSASYSSVKKVTAKPAKVTISSVSSTKSRSATVKWKKVSGATGYQVAYRRKGSSTWTYVTVKTNSKKFTALRVKNYYVKVRAYKTYNGTKYYGSWSSEKAMKVK